MGHEESFKANLREALARLDIRQREFAAALGLRSQSAVPAMLRMDREMLPRTMHKAVAALNAILAERGDHRRFTLDGLRATPDPEPDSGALALPSTRGGTTTGHVVRLGSEDVVALKLAGSVPCGTPMVLIDAGEIAMIPRSWLERGMTAENTFVAQASGNSMEDARIFDGDIMLIRTDISPQHGDRVLVNTSEGATIKRYQRNQLGPGGFIVACTGDPGEQDSAADLHLLGPAQVQGVVRKVYGER
jgi:SOS-response transcriptional repressor LexA